MKDPPVEVDANGLSKNNTNVRRGSHVDVAVELTSVHTPLGCVSFLVLVVERMLPRRRGCDLVRVDRTHADRHDRDI